MNSIVPPAQAGGSLISLLPGEGVLPPLSSPAYPAEGSGFGRLGRAVRRRVAKNEGEYLGILVDE